MTYSFHPSAEREYLIQIAYYEEKRPGLGGLFLAEFERTLSYICKAPERYKKVDGLIRLVGMKTYPFNVLYRVSDGKVQVLAVAHKRRKPAYWQSRL